MRLGLMTGHGLAVGDADGLAAAMLFPHQIPGAQLPGGAWPSPLRGCSSTRRGRAWSNSSIGEDLRGSVLSTTAAKGLRKISTCCRMM